MLAQAGPALWIADGPSVSFLGLFPYPTRMAAARLEDGSVWVWSPTELGEELAAAIDALGPVRHLVAPNKLHHLFLPAWRRRYPEAQLYAAPGLARKRRDLAFTAELDDRPPAAWGAEIDQVVVRGSWWMEEVVFFHRPSRTALVCDLIQRFAPAAVRGWRGQLLRWDGLVGPSGSTPRDWRVTFWNRPAARRAVRAILAWEPARLVIAHGELPDEVGRSAVERGFRWLL